MKPASHHYFLWTLMDLHWRDSIQRFSSHLGLNRVIVCPHHGLADLEQKQLSPGRCGRFCVRFPYQFCFM
ncbi:hypothetical protein F7725_005091 [Dissostichus mawsoni]|uniref:Uncharacterized protein n=1 Tax=Dissostichus mawsoni TaxID=36200 RepID=A0A7J5YQE8_DISMA|nr:hypothetical protein F7725_005091 [Dissostichus mawsoni]